MVAVFTPAEAELLGQLFGPVLGTGEDEEGTGLFAQHLEEEIQLTVLIHFVIVERYLFAGLGSGTRLDADRVAHVGGDELLHAVFDGGGEEQRLAL